ncbi:hypothetical protein E2C01_034162 [Portunus trituberculatus]|uniref:Uncharacterized protein n=1 Tax=Portunus trituberculatus TaxID=210409 RepID=A0A5B7EZT9_PORTR|nr:hypothetical protein [Portunus trituberculatus]
MAGSMQEEWWWLPPAPPALSGSREKKSLFEKVDDFTFMYKGLFDGPLLYCGQSLLGWDWKRTLLRKGFTVPGDNG